MKTRNFVNFLPLLLLISSCASNGTVSQIDISNKANVELIGHDGLTVKVQTKEKSEAIVFFHPNTGAQIYAHLQNGRLNELLVESRLGDTKTVLVDNNGDGLPDERLTIQILKDGGERATKIERLTWTSQAKESDQPPK